jgi:hypothetical protein
MNLDNSYKVEAILPPFVFLKDKNDNLTRIRKDDINDHTKVRLGNTVEQNLDGTYSITGNLTDGDCVGGVCPIK